MELNIISSSDKKTLKILWLEIDTVIGTILIQRGHAPIVLELKPKSSISYCISSTGKVEILENFSGFVEVSRSYINILLI